MRSPGALYLFIALLGLLAACAAYFAEQGTHQLVIGAVPDSCNAATDSLEGDSLDTLEAEEDTVGTCNPVSSPVEP